MGVGLSVGVWGVRAKLGSGGGKITIYQGRKRGKVYIFDYFEGKLPLGKIKKNDAPRNSVSHLWLQYKKNKGF